jgi:hypothetical protein
MFTVSLSRPQSIGPYFREEPRESGTNAAAALRRLLEPFA